MIEHDKRRFEDTTFGRIIYSWPAIVGILSVIYAMAKGSTILTTLAEASSKSASFQEAQIGINVKLQTLIDTDRDRINALESWRDRTNRYK